LNTRVIADMLLLLRMLCSFSYIPLSLQKLRLQELFLTQCTEWSRFAIDYFFQLSQGDKITAFRNYAKTLQLGSLHTAVACCWPLYVAQPASD